MGSLKKIERKYIILNFVKNEYPDIDETKLVTMLNNVSDEDLERLYDLITKLGVKEVLKNFSI